MGREARHQSLAMTGKLPDALVACVEAAILFECVPEGLSSPEESRTSCCSDSSCGIIVCASFVVVEVVGVDESHRGTGRRSGDHRNFGRASKPTSIVDSGHVVHDLVPHTGRQLANGQEGGR